jgi:competence protein ComEA
VTLYSRRQLVLLLALVATAGLGLAIGEWRRMNPELAAVLERLDAPGEAQVDAASPATPDGAGASTPRAGAPAATGVAAAERRAGRRSSPLPPSAPIDLNRATVADLERLPGIGPVLAARIVSTRETAGPFASVDDLGRVPGLNRPKLARIRDLVAVAP